MLSLSPVDTVELARSSQIVERSMMGGRVRMSENWQRMVGQKQQNDSKKIPKQTGALSRRPIPVDVSIALVRRLE